MKSEKELLRDTIINIRRNITPKDKKIWENEIFKKLKQVEEFKKAKKVLIYNSTMEEIDTKKIIEYCLKLNMEVYLPRVDSNTKKRKMKFYKVYNLKNLIKSNFSIYEPEKIKENLYNGNALDCVCITPALCFDKDGYRLGYGGGYYDRFFTENPTLFRIGLCYSLFFLDKIPRSKKDESCNIVIKD